MAMMMISTARGAPRTLSTQGGRSWQDPRLALAQGVSRVVSVPSSVTLDHQGALHVYNATYLCLRGVNDPRRPLEILCHL